MITLPFTRYHPIIGYVFIESVQVSVPHERGSYIIKTNRDGIRSNKDYDYHKKDKGLFRILVFGDSFTAADSVNNNERYTDLLEKRMINTEVINFGLSGTGTDQQFLLFKEKGQKYEFDMILICPLLENIRRNKSMYRIAINRATNRKILVPKPTFYFQNGKLSLKNVPVPEERPCLDRASKEILAKTEINACGFCYNLRQFIEENIPSLKSFLVRFMKMKVFREYYDPQNDSWILMSEIFKEFTRLANGKKIVICPLPYHYQIEGIEESRVYLERFQSLDNGDSIRVLNIFKYFNKMNKKEKRQCRWSRDVHYTPFAHTIVADGIHKELKKIKSNYLLLMVMQRYYQIT